MNLPSDIRTERVTLRQWRDSDLEPFARLNADARVMAHFPKVLGRDASDALAQAWRTQISERGWGLWAAELRASGEFLGFVGLQVPAAPLPFGPCVEVGWRLAHEHWGHGYASEAARAAVQFGFMQLKLAEIVSFTAVGNQRSRAVMQSVGLLQDPFPFEHPSVPEDSPLRTHYLYRLANPLAAPGPQIQAMRLVRPAHVHLPSYVAALEKGWSPDSLRGAEAASRRVIALNGGVLVEQFTKPAAYGSAPGLRYRIPLVPVSPARRPGGGGSTLAPQGSITATRP